MSPDTARSAFVLELRNAHAMERQSLELMKWQAVRLGDYPDIEKRIRACLRNVPPDRLSVSPDCGLSQTARWASFAKLSALVQGARRVRAAL